MIGGAAMQGVKIWNAPLIETNKSITALTLMRAAASTIRSVGAVHGVEPCPAIADMDLQPVAVLLQLVRPARPIFV